MDADLVKDPPRDPGRKDYAELVDFRGLAPGEPFFMLRAKDQVSGPTVRAWAVLARAAGAPPAVIEQALDQADRLDAWPTKKIPDAGHLSAEEQTQLTYALSRRAWSAREDCADLRIMLAEERALTALRAQLRPILRDLADHGRRLENGNFIYQPGTEPGDIDAIQGLLHLETVLRAAGASVS